MATLDGAASLRVVKVPRLAEPLAPQLHSDLDLRASDLVGTMGFGKYFEGLWDSREATPPSGATAANIFSMFLTQLWDSTRAQKGLTHRRPEKSSNLSRETALIFLRKLRVFQSFVAPVGCS